MSLLEDETDENHKAFFKAWTAQAATNWENLRKFQHFKSSYRRLACLNTIRGELVDKKFSSGSAGFFLEAHNDAIVSHVSASTGAWRAALQSLRSCIENVACSIYYMDHPVEFSLWSAGRFRISFSELHNYLAKHPVLAESGENLSGLSVLQSEYATLSKAVHASAAKFRMTGTVPTILLWDTDIARLGASYGRKLVTACGGKAAYRGGVRASTSPLKE